MKSKLFKIIAAAILAAILICAVALRSSNLSDAQIPSPTPEATATPSPAPTPSPTPPPTPEPTPTPVVAEAGTYFDRFVNPDTQQYVDYVVMIPENCYEGMPLILFLHGDGLTNRIDWLPTWGIAKRATEIYGDSFPFILLMPNNRFPEWYEDGMGSTLKGMTDAVAGQYSVDTDKIIITGHSRGSIATWQMVNEYGVYFSCAVPCSCGAAHVHGENFVGVPVSAFCGGGIGDQTSYYREMKTIVDDINNHGGSATMTILWEYDHPDMDYAPYTEELFSWMLEQ